MDELPSCLPTCSREHGHAAGCPVLEARLQGRDAGLYAPKRQVATHQPKQSAAAARWGAAVIEIREAQQEQILAEAALASARSRYAAAQKEAREALAELQAEAKSIMGEE